MTRLTWPFAPVLPALLLAVGLGCSASQTTGTAGDLSVYKLKVSKEGQSVAYLTLPELKALPKVSLELDGKTQTGSTVLSVLTILGLNNFNNIVVVGQAKGRIGTSELRLTRAQVTERTILDINRRGQTKLASPDIPAERRIVDVTELRVK